MKIKRLVKEAELPRQAYIGDAGFDLVSYKSIELAPLQRVQVMLGFSIEIPAGHVGLVCPRSGLASKKGITVLNSPGIIDSGYRGEVGVILINLSNQNISLPEKTRIAQLVIVSHSTESVEWVETLGFSDRGEKGFGSTGEDIFKSEKEY